MRPSDVLIPGMRVVRQFDVGIGFVLATLLGDDRWNRPSEGL